MEGWCVWSDCIFIASRLCYYLFLSRSFGSWRRNGSQCHRTKESTPKVLYFFFGSHRYIYRLHDFVFLRSRAGSQCVERIIELKPTPSRHGKCHRLISAQRSCFPILTLSSPYPRLPLHFFFFAQLLYVWSDDFEIKCWKVVG